MTDYVLGDQLKIAAAFTDSNAAAADPTTVTFKMRSPTTGTVTTYVYGTDAEVVKTATGGYYVLATPATAGAWYFRFAGTGAVIAAVEDSVDIKSGAFS